MNNDLQHKMYHFEADPPPEVWNRINDALDAEQSFPQRLFQYEERPPSRSWEAIEAALEEEIPSFKVVPITRYKKPIRYIAAAASIMAVVLLVSRFTDNKNNVGAPIGGTQTTVTTNQSSILPTEKPPVVIEENREEDLAVNSSTEDKNPRQFQQRKMPASIRTQASLAAFAFSENFLPGKADKEVMFDFSALDSYMVYSDGEGNAMKLPKKLFSLVNCQDGDETCKERVQQLQQKLASSAVTTDFAGILEILRQLQ